MGSAGMSRRPVASKRRLDGILWFLPPSRFQRGSSLIMLSSQAPKMQYSALPQGPTDISVSAHRRTIVPLCGPTQSLGAGGNLGELGISAPYRVSSTFPQNSQVQLAMPSPSHPSSLRWDIIISLWGSAQPVSSNTFPRGKSDMGRSQNLHIWARVDDGSATICS